MPTSDPEQARLALRQFYRLLRAEDQLDLRMELIDLTPVAAPSGEKGFQLNTAVGGYIVLTLPPQQVLESVDKNPGSRGQVPVFPNETTLIFEVPAGATVPFSVEGILGALPRLKLLTHSDAASVGALEAPAVRTPAAELVNAAALARSAQRGTGTLPVTLKERARRTAARSFETSETAESNDAAASAAVAPARAGAQLFKRVTELRFPSRLQLSPRGGATRFNHSAHPVRHGDKTELWHTRLSRLRTDGKLVEPPVELIALDTHELDPSNSSSPAVQAWRAFVSDQRLAPVGGLSARVRKQIVEQSRRRPLRSPQLYLSALGATADLQGDWPSNSPLLHYRQRIAMGRDMVTEVAQRGTLYPLKHEATLVTTTTRTMPLDNGMLAGLTTASVITVEEPTRDYPTRDRDWPWSSISLLTDKTAEGVAQRFAGAAVLLVHADGKPWMFRCVGVDRGGRTSHFELPLVFVPDGYSSFASLAQAYDKALALRTVQLHGQVLSVAEPSAAAPEATDVIAQNIVLKLPAPDANGGAPRPSIEHIVGTLPTLQRFSPSASVPKALRFAQPYLTSGFDAKHNAGEVLLELMGEDAPVLDLTAGGVTGGFVQPRFPLRAVSRLVGPVGAAAAQLASGSVSASELLGKLLGDVTLFGVFPLAALLGDLRLDVAKDVPKLLTHAIDGVSVPSLSWRVPLFAGSTSGADGSVAAAQAGPVGGALRAWKQSGPSQLVLDVRTELTQPVDPSSPVMHNISTCRIENVELVITFAQQPIVIVPLRYISFTSRDGKKPDLDAEVGELQFHGILGFLRSLAALCPANAWNDPPALEVTSDGVRSSISLPVPSLAVGAFTLENINFGAALQIWFDRAPELHLDFGSRDNRFRLTVMALGGGGFFGLALSTAGLLRLDGALEFGAAVSVNLGVARGSVSVMGGIYFKYTQDEGIWIEGYVEVRGEIDVLGLVEVGVKLLVALAYESATGDVTGRAELVAYAKVLFFKKTVRVPFKYTFAGAGGGAPQQALAAGAPEARAGMPSFLDQMAPAAWPADRALPWDSYCLSFA